MGSKIIEVQNINKSFHDHVIFEKLSFEVPENSFTTIFGSSGSGKSTLLNIIGLLENYDSGEVKLFAEAIPKVNSKKALLLRRKEISYLFQNFGLIESKTIQENLMIGLQYIRGSPKDKKKQMNDALSQVHLSVRLNEKVYNLSGGEQQRLAIARTILKPSSLILADEPTGSLDNNNKKDIIELLESLKESGKTIVVVSHDPDFKEKSDNVLIL
ncbi:putative bacteriocin export ABC transporter [Tetragenococcus koreensis]|uniref:putative bacteriocin export ABC transporter n=1 Tax=Tetragenococcus koreensis TaxID=290335 RepID=UPI001F16F5D8|nr:putative bacteriocin export ABC transporter [Tetragenococcus koreensis]MDN6641293.1 putative bacteriocin export ABC transporter [Tetragenococcus sp.]MDN6836633.1 putative bacteriocin export ABC transporter [Lactococcus lactis]MCF1585403.1 putative bacteriocin export ABC transporter [Tetragenococcus koreensis]MCF1614949.1 putative bacteriocin export ABC transporter [Tetragenococcus koreensis]MCF1624777.1 putative bacteriocin export ABC transporter [Tetragenococcus koreensis]